MKIQFVHNFESIICLENLLESWRKFLNGKRGKKDVQEFSINLMDNIFSLYSDLCFHNYKHGNYRVFNIHDPKPRKIHKASIRDRIIHHAIYRILYPFFDKLFIIDSFSCRLNKGAHKAIGRSYDFFYKVSKNNTKTCWVLKCDVKKFFASIDHNILINILEKYILDKNIIKLLREVIESFSSEQKNKGLPLGNLTSQLFANIYMNEFDWFIKRKLKVKYYIRYTDDFIILSEDKKWLENRIEPIKKFLDDELKLEIHSNKIFIKTMHSGIDFLGLINFPNYRILRTKTKKRMFRKIKQRIRELKQGEISEGYFNQTIQSYLGGLKHCSGHKIEKEIFKLIANK